MLLSSLIQYCWYSKQIRKTLSRCCVYLLNSRSYIEKVFQVLFGSQYASNRLQGFKFANISMSLGCCSNPNCIAYCCDVGFSIVLFWLQRIIAVSITNALQCQLSGCVLQRFFSLQSLQKEAAIKELKLTVVECSSVIEVWDLSLVFDCGRGGNHVCPMLILHDKLTV